jgi:hypothetical protein
MHIVYLEGQGQAFDYKIAKWPNSFFLLPTCYHIPINTLGVVRDEKGSNPTTHA